MAALSRPISGGRLRSSSRVWVLPEDRPGRWSASVGKQEGPSPPRPRVYADDRQVGRTSEMMLITSEASSAATNARRSRLGGKEAIVNPRVSVVER